MSALVAVCNRPALLTPWPRISVSLALTLARTPQISKSKFSAAATCSYAALAWAPPSDHPRPAREVQPWPLLGRKTRLDEKARYRPGLGRADLEQRDPSRTQHVTETRHDAAIGDKPIRTSVQRPRRIVVGNLAREPGHLCGCEIGRIGNHEIECFVDPVEPIAGDEACPVRDAKI